MKTILSIAFFLTGFTAVQAQRVIRKGSVPDKQETPKKQADFDIAKLNGYWQETERASSDYKKVTFTDTLNLYFYDKDSVRYKSGKFLTKRGSVEWTGDALLIAGNQYTIVQFTEKKLVLFDMDHIRTLNKIDINETPTPLFEKQEVKKPIKVDTKLLLGEWSVYRTKATPGDQTNAPIRNLIFEKSTSDKNYAGTLQQNEKGKLASKSASYFFKENTLTIKTDVSETVYEIITLTESELVIKDKNGTLFFKKL